MGHLIHTICLTAWTMTLFVSVPLMYEDVKDKFRKYIFRFLLASVAPGSIIYPKMCFSSVKGSQPAHHPAQWLSSEAVSVSKMCQKYNYFLTMESVLYFFIYFFFCVVE